MYAYEYDEFGSLWKKIFKPVTNITKPILHPVVKITHKASEIGTDILRPITKNIIRPILKPIRKVMPKITIGGHRYDLGGSRALQKTITGAVAGFYSGGPYGAIAGGLLANFQKGAPDVVKDLAIGVTAGYLTTLAAPSTSTSSVLTSSGGTSAASTTAAGTTAGTTAGVTGASSLPTIAGTTKALTAASTVVGTATKILNKDTGEEVYQEGTYQDTSKVDKAGMFNASSITIISIFVASGLILLFSNKDR